MRAHPMSLCSILLLLLTPQVTKASGGTISPSDVFSQAERIHQEVTLLKGHMGKANTTQEVTYQANLKPRHVWQKGYMVLIKLNIFRRLHGMPRRPSAS